MWFDTKKVSETEDSIEYEYGYETHELTGRLSLSKRDGSVTLVKKDKDYTEKCFAWIAGMIEYYFPKENYPDKKMIATG